MYELTSPSTINELLSSVKTVPLVVWLVLVVSVELVSVTADPLKKPFASQPASFETNALMLLNVKVPKPVNTPAGALNFTIPGPLPVPLKTTFVPV